MIPAPRAPGGEQWCCVINARAKPGGYAEFASTVLSHSPLPGEPEAPEYRVESDRADAILRVGQEACVVVTAALFLRADFLEDAGLNFHQIQALLDCPV